MKTPKMTTPIEESYEQNLKVNAHVKNNNLIEL